MDIKIEQPLPKPRRSFKDIEYTKDRLEAQLSDAQFELSHKTSQLEKRQTLGIILIIGAFLVGVILGAALTV